MVLCYSTIKIKLTCIILLYIDIQYQFCCACECSSPSEGHCSPTLVFFLERNGFYVKRNVTVFMWL